VHHLDITIDASQQYNVSPASSCILHPSSVNANSIDIAQYLFVVVPTSKASNSSLILGLAIQVSAAAHTTCKVVVVIVVIARTKEVLRPSLEGLLEGCHEPVLLLSILSMLASGCSNGGAARGKR
jgi:hypothetical protein